MYSRSPNSMNIRRTLSNVDQHRISRWGPSNRKYILYMSFLYSNKNLPSLNLHQMETRVFLHAHVLYISFHVHFLFHGVLKYRKRTTSGLTFVKSRIDFWLVWWKLHKNRLIRCRIVIESLWGVNLPPCSRLRCLKPRHQWGLMMTSLSKGNMHFRMSPRLNQLTDRD